MDHETTRLRSTAGAVLAWPQAVLGQVTRKRPLIGRLSFASRDAVARYIDRFLSGMRELGYAEGRDFDINYAMADFQSDQLPRVAAGLVNVIVAGATLEALPPKKPLPRFQSLPLRSPIRLRSVSPRATPGPPAMWLE